MLERIKDGIVELKSDMIEGEPCVYGVGFVTIKLSGKWMAEGNGMSLPPDMDEHFRTVEEDGEVLIYVKDEGNMKPLIREKSRTRKSRTRKSRDGCFGYPLEDLGALWHGLVGEKAYWIVCVTPTQQQDYIETCFNVRWTTDSFWPLATSVGFKTCSTSLEDLLSFLYKAQYPCEAGEAAKVLGYTDEAVLDCPLTYNEMLDIKASKLGMEEDKVTWSEGVERELGFHLVMFTELINESYLSFFPHLLCRYLYGLSEKFSCFYETYKSSGFEVCLLTYALGLMT
ncbi:arginine--tRNA ligase, chloroplastic/mitochondrial [Tanacetum coccineum]